VNTKRLKILYVITKGNWGGAQRYVFDLATSVPEEKFEPVVAFGEGEILGKKLKKNGVRTIKVSSLKRDVNPLLDFKTFLELLNLFRTERPDIVHLNSSKVGGLGALAARLVGVPKIIFTGHGWAWNEDRSIFSKILMAKIYWLIIQLCHTTIAVSKNNARQIYRLPLISKKKIVIIPNGIDETTFEEKSVARSKIGGGFL